MEFLHGAPTGEVFRFIADRGTVRFDARTRADLLRAHHISNDRLTGALCVLSKQRRIELSLDEGDVRATVVTPRDFGDGPSQRWAA